LRLDKKAEEALSRLADSAKALSGTYFRSVEYRDMVWFAKILCMRRINSLAAKRLWVIRYDSGHGSAAPLLSRLANRHGTDPTRHLSRRTGMKSKQLLAKCEAPTPNIRDGFATPQEAGRHGSLSGFDNA
jgi:hypothetical protein